MSPPIRILPAGDAALLVAIGDPLNRGANPHCVALADALTAASLPGVLDVVPTTRSVGVYFDPMRTNHAHLVPLIASLAGTTPPNAEAVAVIDVPVCYGGAHGPDLADVAKSAGVTSADVVALHAGVVYQVQMLGFAPGFAYLGDVSPRIAAPRHAQPRARVAAGSVGIADTQTGIYPFDMPGGWQIIGRTPIRPCDLSRAEPFLFAAGDRVRFHAIDDDEFARRAAEGAA